MVFDNKILFFEIVIPLKVLPYKFYSYKKQLGVNRLRNFLEDRAVKLGEYIAANKATVRSAAKVFGVSKSTVHKDVTERLRNINVSLYNSVKKVLDINKAQRHIRGGYATKHKYEMCEHTKKT